VTRGLRAAAGAGVVAAALSGAPSSVAWAAGRLDALDATRRIGRAFFGRDSLVLGGVGHLGVSLLWALAAPALARRRRSLLWGAAYGAAIYAVDFKLIAPRRFPQLAELDSPVQLADHLAYGVTVVEAARRLQR
jgi:hypothetical protein